MKKKIAFLSIIGVLVLGGAIVAIGGLLELPPENFPKEFQDSLPANAMDKTIRIITLDEEAKKFPASAGKEMREKILSELQELRRKGFIIRDGYNPVFAEHINKLSIISLKEAKSKAKYELKTPKYQPNGSKLTGVSVSGEGSEVSIFYETPSGNYRVFQLKPSLGNVRGVTLIKETMTGKINNTAALVREVRTPQGKAFQEVVWKGDNETLFGVYSELNAIETMRIAESLE